MADTTIPPLKTCTKCKCIRPPTVEYFQRCKRNKDGLDTHCKPCRREITAKYAESNRLRANQWRVANRDRERKNKAVYYASHQEEIREKERQRKRKKYGAVLEANRVRRRAFRQTERGKLVHRVDEHKRRQLIRKSESHFSLADVTAQLRSQRGRCWHCGENLSDLYHIDHLIPLSRGGSNDAGNIVISCPKCNWSRNNKLVQEWNGKLF